MKAAIYTRVSTSDQSTDMQISELRKFAKSRSWKVVAEVEEIASGAKDDRPKRIEIIKLARQRKIDVVLVWKLDRWGRNLSDLVITLDELKSLGVAFFSAQEMFDLTTPMGKAFMGLLAVIADFERSMIAERVRAGINRYREKNNKWGRPASAMRFAPIVEVMLKDKKSKGEISRELGISKSSISRIMRGMKI